ncbi:hypothetical protein [Streptomyces sp. ADI92-24]|uniref:hypothetical protein n=1 Tax=Streptomyces sp. ADI92-24 TaxID=1522756 RepID=UPI000F558C08|nr:hypothetical protein [Streptomyces sp. ADI92-24]
MSEASSTSLLMAVEAAYAASKAAAHTAALILIEADGGRGNIHRAQRGEGPADAWCVVTSANFTAHILSESHGDRAHVTLSVAPAVYEQMRIWSEARDDCRHDHGCICRTDPWPTRASLSKSTEERRINYRADFGERGRVRLTFDRVTVTLYDEPVTVVDTLLRIARSAV